LFTNLDYVRHYNYQAMKKSIEIEARTTKEAIEQSLKTLKVKRDQVEIKILAEGEKGLFGMEGASKAKVRVTVKDSA